VNHPKDRNGSQVKEGCTRAKRHGIRSPWFPYMEAKGQTVPGLEMAPKASTIICGVETW